jgi:hypothetical protein
MLSVDFKTTYLYSKLETEGKQTNGEINEKTKHKRQREFRNASVKDKCIGIYNMNQTVQLHVR